MRAHILTTSIAAAAATLALAAPAASAAPTGEATTSARTPAYVTSAVVSGTIEGVPGNRHQVVVDRSHRAQPGGWIRSFSCPEGATVTMSWASSRCTHRLTQDLRLRSGTTATERLSSTTRSVTVSAAMVGVNRDNGYKRSLPLSLSVVAAKDADVVEEAGARFWDPSTARGTIGGASYRDAGAWVGYR